MSLTTEASVPRRFDAPDIITLPVTFLLGVLICLARCPSTILHPELWAEDGAVWFNNAYSQGWFTPLLHPHTGYLQTFPRLIADVGLVVPLRRLPLLFVLVALVVQVLPAIVIVSRRYAILVPNLLVRVILAGLYLVVPNSLEINVNLTNAQWHLALLAVMVVLASEPARAWKAFDVVVIVASGLTGPFTLALLPVAYLIRRRRRTDWSRIVLALIAAVSLVQLLELLLTSQGSRHLGPLGITVRRLIEILGGQVVGGTALGTSWLISPTSPARYLVVSIVLLGAASAVVVFVMWRCPIELKLFNMFVGLVLTAFLASPVVAESGSQWQVLATNANLRYWFFPALAILVDVVWLAGQRRIARGIPAVIGLTLMAVILVFGVRSDFKYPILPKPNWAAEVKAFDAAPPGTPVQFDINPAGFPMTIVKK